MTIALLGTLVVLALVDSTSFGTLLIPIWLMLAPGRLRPGRILVFLGTVAAFYLVLGLLLVAGVASFADELSDAFDTRPVQIAQVVVGAALLAAGLWVGRRAGSGGSGRLMRWRERAVGDEGSVRGLMTLALTAALIEAASMVPYLAAIGLIGTSDLRGPAIVATLVGYCLVMVLPAVVLLVGRVFAARHVQPLLQRINDWMARTGQENTAWILGIIGVLVASSALQELGVMG
ncbi:GAP family protein [Aeromicrobium endophyticum]|uniref:GAP family protein n=1 Tax=Aeromicrobium endophyticum TaxID=2292704 RepID=A0A371P3W6_9ACTN|nr:GAP family protein [Aeromicrobium endophyticum]REK70210.1 GAP family protein [Aeromicrobium endophyticum]